MSSPLVTRTHLPNAHHHPPETSSARGNSPAQGRVNDVVGQSLRCHSHSQGKTKKPQAQEPKRDPGGRRQQGRRPRLAYVLSGLWLSRSAARQLKGSLNQPPPRSTLVSALGAASGDGSGSTQGDPSCGPPCGEGCHKSPHHSYNWPCISDSPQRFTRPWEPIAKGRDGR